MKRKIVSLFDKRAKKTAQRPKIAFLIYTIFLSRIDMPASVSLGGRIEKSSSSIYMHHDVIDTQVTHSLTCMGYTKLLFMLLHMEWQQKMKNFQQNTNENGLFILDKLKRVYSTHSSHSRRFLIDFLCSTFVLLLSFEAEMCAHMNNED
jgi:hypothetical protein